MSKRTEDGFRYIIESDEAFDNPHIWRIMSIHKPCRRAVGGSVRFQADQPKPDDETIETECLALLRRNHRCPARHPLLYRSGMVH